MHSCDKIKNQIDNNIEMLALINFKLYCNKYHPEIMSEYKKWVNENV